MLGLDSEVLIAGFAAIAAWLAALFAYMSYCVSRRALELAEQQNNSFKTNITAYLADSFRSYDSELKKGKYIFSIAYTNRSDSPDSIIEVSLETFYVNEQDRISHLISPHEECSGYWLSGNAEPAMLPIIIQPRSAITGWFIFGVSTIAQNSKRINKYRVVARNGNGEEVAVDSFILREIKHEKIS